MLYNDGTSTGIEPYYAFEYYRASRSGFAKQEVNFVKQWKEQNPGQELPDFFVTSQELTAKEHVYVQAAIQKWVDSSISKTANAPNDFTVEETKELYELAFDLGCKGVTIYRDGSREAQVLSTDKDKAKLESDIEEEKLAQVRARDASALDETWEKAVIDMKPFIKKRPKRLYGFTEKVSFMYGDKMAKAYITINSHEGEVFEVIIQTKATEVSSLAKAMGLMTTKLLRLGATEDNLQQAIDTLSYDQTMGTLPFVVANLLREQQKVQLLQQAQPQVEITFPTSDTNSVKTLDLGLKECPECKQKTFDKINCTCMNPECGVSKCN